MDTSGDGAGWRTDFEHLVLAATVVAVLLAGCLGASGPSASEDGDDRAVPAPSTEVSAAQAMHGASPPGHGGENASGGGGSTTVSFDVGETVDLGGVAVTVDEVYSVEHVPSEVVDDADASQKHVVVDVTVENGRRSNVTVSDAVSVGLANPQGYLYEPHHLWRGFDEGFGAEEVAADERRRGRIVFTVPRRSTAFVLRFTGQSGTTAELDVPDRQLRYSVDRASAPRPEGRVAVTGVETEYVLRKGDENTGTIRSVGVRIENTGELSFRPRLDVEYQHGTTEIRLDDQGSFSALEPGGTVERTVRLDEQIDDDGTYRVQIYLLDGDTGAEMDRDLHLVDVK